MERTCVYMKEIQFHKPEQANINIFLWGREGVGKTYLTTSMPKPCFYLTFDPNALNGANDLLVNGSIKETDIPMVSFDEGDYKAIRDAYKNPLNPFNLEDYYKQIQFKTLVIDSISSFFKLAMQYGVEYASNSLKENSTIERPGFAGYGVRSVATKEMIFNVINWCNKHKVNCVIIGHEGEQEKDENTGLRYHTVSLSGDIPLEIARWCDECWMLAPSQDSSRGLVVKPINNARPIKSRMFSSDVKVVQADNLNLEHLLDAWRANGKITNQVLNDISK